VKDVQQPQETHSLAVALRNQHRQKDEETEDMAVADVLAGEAADTGTEAEALEAAPVTEAQQQFLKGTQKG
jgi:hypothetical protein